MVFNYNQKYLIVDSQRIIDELNLSPFNNIENGNILKCVGVLGDSKENDTVYGNLVNMNGIENIELEQYALLNGHLFPIGEWIYHEKEKNPFPSSLQTICLDVDTESIPFIFFNICVGNVKWEKISKEECYFRIREDQFKELAEKGE